MYQDQSLYMKCNIATRYVTTFCQGNNLPKGCLKQVLVISGQKRALFHNHGCFSWNGPKNNLYWQYLLCNYCSRKNTAISGIFVNSELHRTERGSRKATDLLRLRRRKRQGDYRSPNINWIFFVPFYIFSYSSFSHCIFHVVVSRLRRTILCWRSGSSISRRPLKSRCALISNFSRNMKRNMKKIRKRYVKKIRKRNIKRITKRNVKKMIKGYMKKKRETMYKKR